MNLNLTRKDNNAENKREISLSNLIQENLNLNLRRKVTKLQPKKKKRHETNIVKIFYHKYINISALNIFLHLTRTDTPKVLVENCGYFKTQIVGRLAEGN